MPPINGDGRLLASDAVGAPNNPEVLLAFQHLALSGLISGSYTGATTGAAGTLVTQAGTNLPVSPTFGAAFMFDNPDAALGNVSGSAFYFDGTYFHVLKVAMVSGNLPTGGFLTPTQAYEIDNKFDDSNPGTGWILTPKKSALANCADSDTTTAKYDTSKTTASCNFVLRIQ